MSIPLKTVLTALLALKPVASEAAVPEGESLLLLPTRAEDIEAAIQTRFGSALRVALEARALRVTTPEGIAGAEAMQICSANPNCLAEKLGVDTTALAPSLGMVGESWVVSFALLDLGGSRVLSRQAFTAASMETVEAELAGVLERLFSSESTVRPSVPLPEKPRFVFLQVDGAGLPDGTVDSLGQVIAKELQRIEGASVMSRDEVEVMLGVEQLRRVLDKDCDRSCFERLAGALDADYVVSAQVGQLDSTFVVQINAIDQTGEGQVRRHSETYQGSADELIGATRHATQVLFGTLNGVGTLAVSASPEGAQLAVNEEVLGTLPLPPRPELSPGRYTVLLEKDGFLPYRSDVYVNPDGTSVVWAELERAPERWYQKWWVWAIAGVVVAGSATAIGVAAADQGSDTSVVEALFQ